MLLCRIKSSTMGVVGGQDYFLAHEWMHQYSESDGKIGYLMGVMPILMLYWCRKDGATDGTQYFPAATYSYAHYNMHKSISSEFCPQLFNYTDVMNWISSTWNEMNGGSYVVNSKFKLPNIQFVDTYPYYKRYENQADDTYGRYYPVYSLNPPESYDSFKVSILNSSGKRQDYIIAPGNNDALPLPGTYQYFTAISSSDMYKTTYDLSGIIFKVGGSVSYDIVSSYSYNYSQKTLQNFYNDLGISQKIVSDVSTFNPEIYQVDDDGNPTTTLDPDYIANTDLIHNIDMQCNIESFKINGK